MKPKLKQKRKSRKKLLFLDWHTVNQKIVHWIHMFKT